MSGMIFALLAVLAAGIGGRDQVLVAQLAARQGRHPAALVLALGSAAATSALAAWAALALTAQMNGNARLFFAGLACGFAALELIFARAPRPPAEPTHSLGAFLIVLLAQQLTDAARFLILAIALATRAPIAAGVGGALASMALVAAGWMAGEALAARSFKGLRRALGAAMLLVGIALALRAMGRI
ncbi:hypothetical protein [Novosphingobium sp.]|jgi:hypothetical protein|uniref:hypothetical protein n=1 Tax=Novosphingobium sp. TaxID=1874826 RepID=UPI001EB1B798|nr:hypothetical protein [Novosphingobium sp.]MBK6803236.1 hypothetical protein [Novosphingobium sp.]MBK9011091.1 hypothetical protein [Novosphingobium sp.]MBK9011914.1 hypothetical protein [Novosphingobium sp.]